MKTRQSLIASHRGGKLLWPENSMRAFKNTLRLNVEQVEFDVHPTKDGSLVVHHDATLERMTLGTGAVVDYTYAELQKWTIKGTDGECIPLLQDVLALFKPTSLTLRIEIKPDRDMRPYPDLERQVAENLRSYDLLERTVITSFLIPVLQNFHEAQPSVPRIWLVNRLVFRHLGGIEAVLSQARDAGVHEIALHVDDLSAHEMEAADTADVTLGAYGAHDETTIAHVIDLNVPVFTSDRPDLAVRIRETRQLSMQNQY